jgi:hypothetical protein
MKIFPITEILAGFLLLTYLGFSCRDDKDRNCDCDFNYILYKPKGDYNSKVAIFMNASKSRIIGYPGYDGRAGDTTCHPLVLLNGYFLDMGCTYGINSAYLDVDRKDYLNFQLTVTADSFIYYILDKDPFLEYYESKYIFPNDTLQVDTVSLNKIIRNNEIETFFTKLK